MDDTFEPLTHEKVVGLNNLLNIAWLGRGLTLAATVARITTPHGPGTGFLIGTDLLLTNHHVLPSADVAETGAVEFNYQLSWEGALEPTRRYLFDGQYFRSNADLDYAMVRVRESPGVLFGYVDLANRADTVVNEFVSIIQHPNGGPKQICFTDNKVAAVFGNVVQYATDTEPGSSGAPVFNQNWQVVALHHRGGELAGPDGATYFTNQGIQIGAVIRDAAGFLGLPDALYDLAFGGLRAVLVDLLDARDTPGDPSELAVDLVRKFPRFSVALDDWVRMNCTSEAETLECLARAGVAVGAALRQWARASGHEAIREGARSTPAPDPALASFVTRYKGSDDLPLDVFNATLTKLREEPGLAAGITGDPRDEDPTLARAKTFLTGVTVGGSAYDGAP